VGVICVTFYVRLRRRWLPPSKLQARISTMAGERELRILAPLTLEVERNRNAATRCSSFQVTNIFLNFSNDLAALAGFSTAAATAATMLRIKHHSRIRSTSLSLISSFVRSYRRPGKTRGYAAFASHVSCIAGYQCDSVERHSSFKTRVRTWSKRWAPRSVHRICCFFTMRLLTT
jgi:hypothetical protein